MPYISKRNRKKEREKQTAANNRRELIAAGFKRRDLLKMGLLTSAGMLIPKKGLSARPLNSMGAFDDDEPSRFAMSVDRDEHMDRTVLGSAREVLRPVPSEGTAPREHRLVTGK